MGFPDQQKIMACSFNLYVFIFFYKNELGFLQLVLVKIFAIIDSQILV